MWEPFKRWGSSKRRAVHGEGGREGRMKSGITGCCETSVRRQERDNEAANLSRDEFSVSVPSREGKAVDEGTPRK